MKKLSLLVALCLLITVGGVYATWNYAQNEVITDGKGFIESIHLTEMTTPSSMGSLTVDTSGATVVVDDGGHYKPEMIGNGEIVVTLAPNDAAPLEDRGAKPVQLTIGFNPEWTYNEKPVLEYVDVAKTTIMLEPKTASEGGRMTVVPNGELNSYQWVVDIAEVISLLQFEQSIAISTPALYNEFVTIMARGNISITATVVEA